MRLRIFILASIVAVAAAVDARLSAQTSAPDFELVVNSPKGEVTVQCVRGCELAWAERGVNGRAARMSTFTFDCEGPGPMRCPSGRIGGWLKP